MNRAASVALATLLVLGACGKDPVGDGEDCAENADCVSGQCVVTFPGEGYCQGKECKTNGSTAECDPGYVCIVTQGSTGVFGGTSGSSLCRPTCARCPRGQSCPDGAAQTDAKCR